jgi:hypothetical protein
MTTIKAQELRVRLDKLYDDIPVRDATTAIRELQYISAEAIAALEAAERWQRADEAAVETNAGLQRRVAEQDLFIMSYRKEHAVAAKEVERLKDDNKRLRNAVRAAQPFVEHYYDYQHPDGNKKALDAIEKAISAPAEEVNRV